MAGRRTVALRAADYGGQEWTNSRDHRQTDERRTTRKPWNGPHCRNSRLTTVCERSCSRTSPRTEESRTKNSMSGNLATKTVSNWSPKSCNRLKRTTNASFSRLVKGSTGNQSPSLTTASTRRMSPLSNSEETVTSSKTDDAGKNNCHRELNFRVSLSWDESRSQACAFSLEFIVVLLHSVSAAF